MIGLGQRGDPASRVELGRSAPSAPEGRASSQFPVGLARYEGGGGQRAQLVLAVLVSTGLHALLLFGFEHKPAVVRAAVVQQVEVIRLTMPKIEEEPSDLVTDLADTDDAPPAVSVPQLADLPSAVTVNAFVQPLQYVPEVAANLSAAKVTTIPVNIGRTRDLTKMGKIFEIAQLDRQPVPLLQPAPIYPYALRNEVERAEVVVEFIVDSNGDVVAPMVVSSTHRGFEEAALIGVSKWKFRPGVKTGRKVNTRVRVPISFTLQDSD